MARRAFAVDLSTLLPVTTGVHPFAFALVSAPSGAYLSGSVFNYLPQSRASLSFQATVSDALGRSYTGNFSLSVSAPLILVTDDGNAVGTMICYQDRPCELLRIVVLGGTPEYAMELVSDLPAGLTFTDGLFVGQVTASVGLLAVSITVTDARGFVTYLDTFMSVKPFPITTTTTTTTAAPTSNAPQSNAAASTGSNNMLPIIAGAAGGGAALIIIVIVVVLLMRRREPKSNNGVIVVRNPMFLPNSRVVHKGGSGDDYLGMDEDEVESPTDDPTYALSGNEGDNYQTALFTGDKQAYPRGYMDVAAEPDDSSYDLSTAGGGDMNRTDSMTRNRLNTYASPEEKQSLRGSISYVTAGGPSSGAYPSSGPTATYATSNKQSQQQRGGGGGDMNGGMNGNRRPNSYAVPDDSIFYSAAARPVSSANQDADSGQSTYALAGTQDGHLNGSGDGGQSTYALAGMRSGGPSDGMMLPGAAEPAYDMSTMLSGHRDSISVSTPVYVQAHKTGLMSEQQFQLQQEQQRQLQEQQRQLQEQQEFLRRQEEELRQRQLQMQAQQRQLQLQHEQMMQMQRAQLQLQSPPDPSHTTDDLGEPEPAAPRASRQLHMPDAATADVDDDDDDYADETDNPEAAAVLRYQQGGSSMDDE
jgi:hypothetical protein